MEDQNKTTRTYQDPFLGSADVKSAPIRYKTLLEVELRELLALYDKHDQVSKDLIMTTLDYVLDEYKTKQ